MPDFFCGESKSGVKVFKRDFADNMLWFKEKGGLKLSGK